jgi:hypothetical protein
MTLLERFRPSAVLLALATITACTESAPPEHSRAGSLVGTWRIVRHTPAMGTDTSASLQFGSRPRGYLVYDATGHVFLQVQDAVLADSVRSRWRVAPDSTLGTIIRGFQAYFGTYAVDSTALLVTHRIEGELLPRPGVVETATPFRLRGDSLVLGADSLERWYFVRVR